ncbi:MAG TPA: response regulator [Alphaproteobacteria bacterium]|nr:response regulator [Alphaproteobacteria bacterium]
MLMVQDDETRRLRAVVNTAVDGVILIDATGIVSMFNPACEKLFGYTVRTAANGREALDTLEKGDKPDLLFTDIVMPGGVSGWDLAEEAQRRYPSLKVLLTSGYPMESLATHHKHESGATLLNKPYRKADIAARLREVLDAEA